MNSPQRTLWARQGDTETRSHGENVCTCISLSPPLLVSLSLLLRALCVFCGCSLIAAHVHAAPQQLVPLDGESVAAEMVSVDANGQITVQVADKKSAPAEAGSLKTTRSYTFDELVRWGHPVPPRPQSFVVLADGGRLVAAGDWSGGSPVRMDGGDFVVLGDTWNEVRVPRGAVRGIVFAQQSGVKERERLADGLLTEPSPATSLQGAGSVAADTVLLANGDRLTGTLTELDRGSISLATEGGPAKLPLSRVKAIVFGSRRPRGDGHPARILVGLRDGSLIYANAIRAGDAGIEAELAGGLKLAGGKVADIVALQSLAGRIDYLSDLKDPGFRSVPYLSIEWPYQRDRNVLGQPLVVRGKRYLKGIGMHSASRMTFRWDGNYRRFDASVAVDDSAKGRGSVMFGAYVLRDGRWNEVYKSEIVRGNDAPKPVSVDLRDAKGLTLTIDYADRGDELDHAGWLDARLVR
jgi:hypothetical protein